MSFSGDGTITGLVAGGLPDSVIVTNDIVNAAVTTAKLGANSVTTNEIVNGAVTTAKLGSGEASGLAKAWVNFNGTGTVAIRASYNVSSITDNGVGDYTVNFTTAMADANYATIGSAGDAPANMFAVMPNYASQTGSQRVNICYQNSTVYDVSKINVAFFR